MKKQKLLLGISLIGIGIIIGGLITSAPAGRSLLTSSVKNPSLTPDAVISTREKAQVKRVIDGDTIELMDGRKLRYIGVDTPETVDPNRQIGCFGKEASNKNKELVEGKPVELEKDVSETDKFGRLLRYVYLTDGDMVNEILVKQGYAFARTYPPDVKYQEKFRLDEIAAREDNHGLWSSCPVQSPVNFPSTGSTTSADQNVLSGQTSGLTPVPSGCLIKGNISASGEKIYHLPGCGSYTKTVINESAGERWFCTEAEAQKTGWRKATNC